MTTSLVTSSIQHNSDADFRAWGKQVSDQWQAVGLVKTNDTGQVDWNSAVRPAANTYSHYEMYRFNDPLQASRPIFIRIEYGSGGGTNFPGIRTQVGSATNGAGTITSSHRGLIAHGRNVAPSTNASASYCVYVASLGYFAWVGWATSNTSTAPAGMFMFSVQRPLDDTGAPLDEALVTYELQTASLLQSVYSYLGSYVVYSSTQNYALVPGSITSSNFSGDIQLVRHFCATPRIRNLVGVLTYLEAEITRGGTFTTSVFGAPRTYMPVGNAAIGLSASATAAHVPAILWE